MFDSCIWVTELMSVFEWTPYAGLVLLQHKVIIRISNIIKKNAGKENIPNITMLSKIVVLGLDPTSQVNDAGGSQ